MNERIIELWEKAQTCVIDTDCSDYHERLQLKFAELIVRECANIAAINQAENMDWNISEIIKEHFGVK